MADRPAGRRRFLAGLAAGGLAALAGCSDLFVAPDPGTPTFAPTDPESGSGGSAGTARTPTPTPGHVGTAVDVVGTEIALRPSNGQYNTLVDAGVTVENVGDRRIELLNLRVALRYLGEPDGVRVLAVDSVGRRFGETPLGSGAQATLTYDTMFPRDGRADRSTDPGDFDLAVAVRRIEFA